MRLGKYVHPGSCQAVWENFGQTPVLIGGPQSIWAIRITENGFIRYEKP